LMTGLAGLASGQTSPVAGAIQRLPVITLDLRVGSTEKQSKRATYTPPPGWHVRSHYVVCAQRYGHTSYLVSTVPAGWGWASEERLTEWHRQQTEVAA